MTRILMIDDHSLFREAIARLLGREPDFQIVGECATVDEGIEILKSTPVDLVLLDINLGLQQGGAFLPQAHKLGFEGKILVVTAGISKLEAERLLGRGCAGIFLKQDRPQLLIEKIRAVVTPGAEPQEEPAEVLEKLPDQDESSRPFTERERQVLRGVFAGQSNKEIAFELGVSEPLVKAVIQQLFAKTNVRTRAQLVRIAIERHWKELEENSAPS